MPRKQPIEKKNYLANLTATVEGANKNAVRPVFNTEMHVTKQR